MWGMFRVVCEDEVSGARVGVLETAHGRVRTPCFLPVATKGYVRMVSAGELREVGAEALISNALLLYMKPGVEVVAEAGGLHRFMGFEGTIFTDSGGFQVLRREFMPRFVTSGIVFRSPFDGSRQAVTPELCVAIQEALGSDVGVQLDDCPPYGLERERYVESVRRTLRWAEASLRARSCDDMMLFGVVQGGVDPELRRRCAERLVELEFQGYCLGGLSVGEPKEVMVEMIELMCELLPQEKPRYLMGVGSPVEVLEAVARGVDVFDSAFPTRNARHGAVYTWGGKYSITKAKNLRVHGPLEEGCTCPVCRSYSRAYVSHLMRCDEPLGKRLVSVHNLHFMMRLMEGARRAIRRGEFPEYLQGVRRVFGR